MSLVQLVADSGHQVYGQVSALFLTNLKEAGEKFRAYGFKNWFKK
jgi:hypothetical protein